jgi:acyl-CoA synthetase (NDP forming)
MSALGLLLDPRSVVIVGASPDFMRTGGIPIEAMLKNGFAPERLLLVNPKYGEIAGLPCYPSLDALPFAPDLAVLAIRASETLGALRQAHKAGVRAAVLFASGFAEEGTPEGIARQQDLQAFAAETGMLIGGPNGLGHANLKDGSFPTFLRMYVPPPPRGDFALIAQSGNMVATLARSLRGAGIGYTYLINTGNEACVDFSAYLEHVIEDEETRAVVGYVEELRDGARFLRAAARARDKGKLIFLVKAGRSRKGAEAVASHTAAMAGSGEAYDAAFRQIGVACAEEPARLADLVYLERLGRAPAGDRVAVVSISGAACAILSDCLSREGVAIPTLDEATQALLKPLVPSYGMTKNPVDLTGQVTNERASFGLVCDALLASASLDGLVIYLGGYLLDAMAPALIEAARASDRPILVIDTAQSGARAGLEAAGVAVFDDISRAALAYARFAAWKRDLRRAPWRPSAYTRAAAGERRALTEVEAKTRLGAAGVPVIGERACATADAAAQAARALGFPVAVKVLSADILHKSDVGGVRVGLADDAAVRAAFDEVTRNARAARPDAALEGVVVQAMAPTGAAVLVGVRRDPTFGPMMTVGLGGVLTEIYADLAHRLLPVGLEDAEAMLRELKSFPLLDGYRGAPSCDRAALARAMVALSDFALANAGEVAEIELNPLIVSPHGAVAVDALVILDNKT